MTPRDELPSGGKVPPAVDAERLAKLLDGRSTGAERDELLAELERNPDAREVLGDAAAALVELEQDSVPASGAAKVVPIDEKRPRWIGREIVIAIAAVLVIAAALQVSKRARDRNELPRVDRLVALIPATAASPATDWRIHPWREFRGAGQPLTPRGRAMRVGALIADLEALATRGDSSATAIASQVAVLLDEYPGGSSVGDAYRSLADTQSVRAPARRTEAAAAAETLVGRTDLRLGAWLEAARIAAATGDTAFFSRSDTTAAVRAALFAAGNDSGLRRSVTALSTALNTSPRDLRRISTALDTVLGEFAN
jgi:hypothetical protein